MGNKKKKFKPTGKPKMVKGKPKISQKDEEDQSLALFESSIPTAQQGQVLLLSPRKGVIGLLADTYLCSIII